MYRILRKLGRVVGRLVIAVHQTTQRQPPCASAASQDQVILHVVCCVHRERNLQFYTQEEMYMLCEHTCTVHVACTHDS